MQNQPEKVSIAALMEKSGVKFGTSGARGLADDITDLVAYAYTKAFLQYTASAGRDTATRAALAGDLRPSTGRIISACAKAVADHGLRPLYCGRIPSPAVALYGLDHGIPAVMVTGSHIPEDRNGIKFNTAQGEITKRDEDGIRSQEVEIPAGLFDERGMLRGQEDRLEETDAARRAYIKRYLDFFPEHALAGCRVGIYQHSAVGRDIFAEIFQNLGTDAVMLGRSDVFIPVDTEAVREEDRRLAREWVEAQNLDAVVSTDGDSDRPLVSDEAGNWLRGDIAGVLTAAFLGAEAAAVPVSCNSAIEKCGFFRTVKRTRIGSPYVIAGMQELEQESRGVVVGYEANGGFLLQTDAVKDGRRLPALPTRDAVIVLLSILAASVREEKPVSALVGALPPRFTAADRLKSFPLERSAAVLDRLRRAGPGGELLRIFSWVGSSPAALNDVDGLRITFDNQDIIHLRTSGNAPEFRCYTEAASENRAEELLGATLRIMESWR